MTRFRSLREYVNGGMEPLQETKFSSVISTTGNWDMDSIRAQINPRIANEILKIRLGSPHHNDRWFGQKCL